MSIMIIGDGLFFPAYIKDRVYFEIKYQLLMI